jgi:hypothetical protein
VAFVEVYIEIITSVETIIDLVKYKQMINTLLDPVLEKKLTETLVVAMNLA